MGSCPGGELYLVVGSCPSGELSWWGIVLVRSCPSGKLSWWGIVLVRSCPSGESSWWKVVLVRNCTGGESFEWELSRWELSGWDCPVGSCPRTDGNVQQIKDTSFMFCTRQWQFYDAMVSLKRVTYTCDCSWLRRFDPTGHGHLSDDLGHDLCRACIHGTEKEQRRV